MSHNATHKNDTSLSEIVTSLASIEEIKTFDCIDPELCICADRAGRMQFIFPLPVPSGEQLVVAVTGDELAMAEGDVTVGTISGHVIVCGGECYSNPLIRLAGTFRILIRSCCVIFMRLSEELFV